MLNGQPRSVRVVDRTVADETASRRQADPLEAGQIGAPMPGQVLSLAVQVGDAVTEGQALGVVEAMKLETHFRSPLAGTVQELLVRQGEKVQSGDLLVVVG
jgi:pyruvate carboxylase